MERQRRDCRHRPLLFGTSRRSCSSGHRNIRQQLTCGVSGVFLPSFSFADHFCRGSRPTSANWIPFSPFSEHQTSEFVAVGGFFNFYQNIGEASVQTNKITFILFLLFDRTNWPDHKTLPLPSRGLTWDDCPPIPFDEIFTAAPADALSLLRSIMVLDPNKRFSASQCLSHPYFANDPAPTPKEKLVLTTPSN